ncbi:tetronasin resistance transmembrane protein [Listeria floridensis FSL S10-1187]|uniref:Tetronasin resistance transmembrane protein n=1 Tax=Listeria floridensis FSL S10-1187 TaxID=1265817 RepID=A0ABN0RIF4_9LIST|nr:tetronasin resistance protein [Listeria floridensis]EUJ33742.1 tetronasin resistance transmembrane protein [Listeria floridensis FSL S10-1187]
MNERTARWNILFLQYLKRDWKKIIFWIAGLGLFSGAFVPAFKEIAKGSGLIGMFETMRNPAMIAMVGPTSITHAADYTIGAMYAQEMLLFCGLFAAIISSLHVIGHTRKEEDLGLTELVRSFSVGRQANSIAVMLETLLINILLGLVIGGIMTSFQVDTITAEGAFLFGLSIAGAGILGAVIALFCAQIMPSSSGATGAALSLLGLLYILRASTDTTNVDLSTFNPMSWTYLTYPFTENHWFLLIFQLIFGLVIVLLSFWLEGKRDMGDGYLPQREGRAHAKRFLLSVPGLLFKLNKGTIFGWLVGFIVMGAAYGSIYGDMQSFLKGNDLIKQMFSHSHVSLEESFTSTIIIVMISLSAILPIAIVNKLYSEEVHRRFSQLFSTKVTRAKIYWTGMILATLAGTTAILFSSASLGGAAISSMGGSSKMAFPDFFAAGFNFFPAVLFFIGLAGFFLGWLPKFGKIGYIYLGYSFMLNYFGGILNLPNWFAKTAIQTWFPRLPVDQFDLATFLTITAISVALLILGYFGYKRRDLSEGA